MLTQVQRIASWIRSLPLAQAIGIARAVAMLLNLVEAQAVSLLTPRRAFSALAFAGAQSLPAPIKSVANGKSLLSAQNTALRRVISRLLVLLQATFIAETRAIKHALTLALASVVGLIRNVMPKPFALALAESWSPVLRGVGAPLPVSSAESTALLKSAARSLAVVSASATTLGKLALLPLLVAAASTLSLSRQAARALSIAAAEVVVLAKQLGRGAFAIAQAQAAALTRKFGHVLAAAGAATLILAKTYAKRPVVTSAGQAIVTRSVAHAMSLVAAAAAALTFGVANKVFALAQGSVYTLQHAVARTIGLLQIGLVSNQSNVLKPLIKIVGASSFAISKVANKVLTLAFGQVFKISRGKTLSIFAFQVVSEGTANSRAFLIVNNQIGTLSRAITKLMVLTTDGAIIAVRAIATTLRLILTTMLASVSTRRTLARLNALVSVQVASVSSALQKFMALGTSQAAVALKSAVPGLRVAQAQILAIPRAVFKSILAQSASVLIVSKRVRHLLSVLLGGAVSSSFVIHRAIMLVVVTGQGMFLTKRGQRVLALVAAQGISVARSVAHSLILVAASVVLVARQTFHSLAIVVVQAYLLVRQHVYPRSFSAPLVQAVSLNLGRFLRLGIVSTGAMFLIRRFGKTYSAAQSGVIHLSRGTSFVTLVVQQTSLSIIKMMGTAVSIFTTAAQTLLSLRLHIIATISGQAVGLARTAFHFMSLSVLVKASVVLTKAIHTTLAAVVSNQLSSLVGSITHNLQLTASGLNQFVQLIRQRGHQLAIASASLAALLAVKFYGRTRMLFDWMGASFAKRDHMEP